MGPKSKKGLAFGGVGTPHQFPSALHCTWRDVLSKHPSRPRGSLFYCDAMKSVGTSCCESYNALGIFRSRPGHFETSKFHID